MVGKRQCQTELGLAPGRDVLFLARYHRDAEQAGLDSLQQGGLALGVLADDDVQAVLELALEVAEFFEVFGREADQFHVGLLAQAMARAG